MFPLALFEHTDINIDTSCLSLSLCSRFPKLVSCVLCGLNLLYGYSARLTRRPLLTGHRAVLNSVGSSLSRWLLRLRKCWSGSSPADALVNIFGPVAGKPPWAEPLDALRCDIPAVAAHVDVLPHLPQELRDYVTRRDKMFPTVDHAPSTVKQPQGQDRDSYLQVLVAELRSGKTELTDKVDGMASIFGRAKPSGRQRIIWNGHDISQWATKPPKPRHLLLPSSLLGLQTTPDAPFYLCKRDGKVMFDQMRLPVELRSFSGQPGVTLQELLAVSDCDLALLEQSWAGSTKLVHATLLFPRACTWRMGFSWSSTVCQELTLANCEAASLNTAGRLGMGLPPPLSGLPCYHGVATDDIVVLSTSRDLAASAGERLDQAFLATGVTKAPEKDVNGLLDGLIVGIALEDGRRLAPNPEKLVAWLQAVQQLRLSSTDDTPSLSPLQMMTGLGVPHWFGQLKRGIYSVFHHVYQHTLLPNTKTVHPLSASAWAELLLFGILTPLVEVDLTSGWHPHVLATDASSVFGFGIMKAPATSSEAAELGRLAATPDQFVRVTEDPGAHWEEKPRRGNLTRLRQTRSDFRTIICSRARYKEHSGALETTAIVLAARWIARQPHMHGQRHPMLVDALSPRCAITRGRSSAQTLRRGVRQVQALALAASLTLALVYIPSESNPADAPSRGKPPLRRLRGQILVRKHVLK